MALCYATSGGSSSPSMAFNGVLGRIRRKPATDVTSHSRFRPSDGRQRDISLGRIAMSRQRDISIGCADNLQRKGRRRSPPTARGGSAARRSPRKEKGSTDSPLAHKEVGEWHARARGWMGTREERDWVRPFGRAGPGGFSGVQLHHRETAVGPGPLPPRNKPTNYAPIVSAC